MYYHGGGDQGGYVGKILNYKCFNNNKSCWEIFVTYQDSSEWTFTMLESEFEEYNKPKTQKLFPIYWEIKKDTHGFICLIPTKKK